MSPTTIFSPAATPARWVFDLSIMVYSITGVVFAVVFGLLAYSIVKFRGRAGDRREPAQIYGSLQIELAWTIIPILIVLVLFLAAARVVADTQRDVRKPGSLEVDVIGHQFWWEYRYPGLDVVTANELHIPATDPKNPKPVMIRLYSADTVHSFWLPRLAGKKDVVPDFPNTMWIDPSEPGLYLGQCAQYCGAQHAKMLLRLYVESPADFGRWLQHQREPAHATDGAVRGKEIFESTACVNCHTIAGTPAHGRFGPDLTHLMSRDTLGSGIAPNTRENLRAWVKDPAGFKPECLMPAMGLEDRELDAVTDYLTTLL
jgi:cytochrome c oxidase subunit II